MKKPSRYRVGTTFIYKQGHSMFEGTLVKVGPNKWMKHTTKLNTVEFMTNETVKTIFTDRLLRLVHDAGKVEA